MYGAALDAYRSAGQAAPALALLQDMKDRKYAPTVVHLNLVLLTLKAANETDQLVQFALYLATKDAAILNANSFEIVVETVIAQERWKDALFLLREMEKHDVRPSIQSCTNLIYLLEKNREYRAALAIYRYMLKYGYDFYENELLNQLFKKMLMIASLGSDLSHATKTMFVAADGGAAATGSDGGSSSSGDFDVVPVAVATADGEEQTAVATRGRGDDNQQKN